MGNKKLTKDVRSSAFVFWVLSRNLLDVLPLITTDKGKSYTKLLILQILRLYYPYNLYFRKWASYSIIHILQH